MVCFNGLAEAGSFIRLGLNPLDFTWVDLQYLWKQLKNCNNNYQYGEVLSKNYEPIITTRPNKYELEDDEEVPTKHKEAGNSLVDCAYGLTGKIINHEHKNKVRDLIIADKDIELYKNIILEYNLSDLIYMPEIYEKMLAILLNNYTCDDKSHLPHPLLGMHDVYYHSIHWPSTFMYYGFVNNKNIKISHINVLD